MPEARIEREFVGWGAPLLRAVCDRLLSLAREGPEADLSAVVAVVQGSRAGRMLLALLVERAEEAGRALSPPRILTPGELPEALLPVRGAVAGAIASHMAWVEALRAVPRETLASLTSRIPEAGGFRAWSDLARTIGRAHEDLAGEGRTFAGMLGEIRAVPGFMDEERWLAAAAAQERYGEVLRGWGLVDGDLARLEALGSKGEGSSAERPTVILAGIPELPGAAGAALRARAGRIVSIVYSPAAEAERFDEIGCVRKEAWGAGAVGIPDEQVVFEGGPSDQARRALEEIAALRGGFASDRIVIGVGDDEVAPYLERQAEIAGGPGGTSVRFAGGTPLMRTGPYRLLEAVGAYLDGRSLEALAALVRHPDVERYLARAGGAATSTGGPLDWIAALDCYRSEHLQQGVDGCVTATDEGVRGVYDALRAWIRAMLDGVEETGGAVRQAAADWARPVLAVLARVYEEETVRATDPTRRGRVEACRRIRDCSAELAALPAGGGAITAGEAIGLILSDLARHAVPAEPEEDAVEALGWLELLADDAPVAIVTGMNEGRVPAGPKVDPFLPDSVRERLGLPCAAARLARDAYILSAVVASRRAVLIAAKRTAKGDPLWPSRLILGNAGSLVGRIKAFAAAGKAEAGGPVRVKERIGPGGQDRFRVMPMGRLPEVTSMRVTAFRAYLKSPYEFYLTQVLGLGEVDDSAVELDPLAFGSFIHRALEQFGMSPVRHSADEKEIREWFGVALPVLGRERFGERPPPAVWAQVEFARLRLSNFAAWQAARVREGWRIAQEPEWRPKGGRARFDVDGKPFQIRGKIDRIDYHAGRKRWAILDYKTGDNAHRESPGTTHRGRDGVWRDLQLPLYRHLVAELNLEGPIDLGYVAVSRSADEDGVCLLEAAWSKEDLESADRAAEEVVRKVRRKEFGVLGDEPPEEGVLGVLCGRGFVGVDAEGEGEDEE